MPSIGINVNYRPLKIGYCLREGNLDELRQASLINTYLSGGILNPIIPISDSDGEEEIKKKVLYTCPDILFAFDDSLKKRFAFLERDYLPSPFQFRDGIYCEYEGRHYFQSLDIELIIRDIWDTFMKVSSKKYSNCILPKWDSSDELSLLFSIIFGEFTLKNNFKNDYEKSYLRGLKAKLVNIKVNDILTREIFECVTPMIFTAHGLTPHYSSRFRDRGFVIGKSDSFNDLVSFWNFRCNNPSAFFIPLDKINRFEECISSIKEKIGARGEESTPKGHRDYFIYHSKENEGLAKNFQDKYFLEPKLFRTEFKNMPYFAKKGFFYFDDQPVQGNVDKDTDEHYSVHFQLPGFKYSDQKRYFPGRFFVISFSFLTEFSYPQHTFQLPDFSDLNEWYARRIHFQYDRLRVEPERFGIIIEDRTNFLTLRPLYLPDLIQKIFDRSRIKISLSESGKIAKQIVEQMGGIEGCRVFMITGVRKLLSSVTPLIHKTRKQCCDEIKDRQGGSFSNSESLYIEFRQEPKLTPEMVFDFLAKKKVFMPGVVIQCTKCDLQSWISLNKFADFVECPLCGNSFSTLIKNPSGVRWNYRRSGLFGQENNQEGAIPVLLSLLQLNRVKHDIQLFTGHNVKLDGVECETDLIVFDVNRHYYNNRPEIVIGECKSPGAREQENTQSIPDSTKQRYQILNSDIEKLVKIKDLLDKSGFMTHILFATTAKRFSNDEIQRFKELLKKYIEPILFTANELEPYFIYERYKDNVLPHKHAVAYEHLATNSRFIYLEDRDIGSLLK